MNRLIDLGQEIIRAKKLGLPNSYKEVFQILEKKKVISQTLARDLQYLASRRNVLAHEYFDITEETIYALYTKIKIGKKFMQEVQKLVRKK